MIFPLLLEGADPLCRDDRGRLPIHIACENRLLQHNVRVMVAAGLQIINFYLSMFERAKTSSILVDGLVTKGLYPTTGTKQGSLFSAWTKMGISPFVCAFYMVPRLSLLRNASLVYWNWRSEMPRATGVVLQAAAKGSSSPLDVIYFLLRRFPSIVPGASL